MEIIEYTYDGYDIDGWKLPKIEFGKINLIVGDSGTGKTKLLNTIFDLGQNAVADKIRIIGHWFIKFNIKSNQYFWEFQTGWTRENSIVVVKEELKQIISQNEDRILIKRDKDSFKFKGENLPKLSTNVSGISLLKDEDDISPLYQGFNSILCRRFFDDELRKNFEPKSLSKEIIEEIRNKKNKNLLYLLDIGVSNKIAFLKEIFNELYDKLKKSFINIFPFVEDFKIANEIPFIYGIQSSSPVLILSIKEKNVIKKIQTYNMSSGMQKVLLLLLDTLLLPDGGIFLIDEYENSLGISAINFFPDYLFSSDNLNQFILTSHHPYIINNIPIEHWLVFHRKGSNVQIKSGKELELKYGKSKQQQFIQLINDPFYKNGVE